MRALLVHNENAGTDPVPRSDIERVLREAGIDNSYCAHGEEDLNTALAGDFDLIVAAGGDGTVADVVSQLEHTDRPIGILPMGGSNNIANALGVDDDWKAIPAQWQLDRWVPLDRCEADGPWGCKRFVEALGSGVLTEAFNEVDDDPATAEEKQANGRAAFRRALGDAEPFACRVETDEWSWDGDCLMVEAMSIPYVGSRLALARDAQPGDGLLDIILVTPEQRDELLAWAEAPEASSCPIAPRRVSKVRLTVLDRPFRVDDRSPNEQLSGSVDIRVRPSPVKILTLRDRS